MKRRLVLSCCFFTFFTPMYCLAQAGFHSAIASEYRQGAQDGGGPAVPAANPMSITIPAGTHVMMKLTSPVHTTSSTEGSAVFLETTFPVIADNHVVIPEHTRVFGVVTAERRPGRVRGKARMSFQFNELVLPDNRAFLIAGNLQSLPGSSENRTTGKDHTLEPVDQIDADVYTVAASTGVGILAGSISHVGIGVPEGALIGGSLGLAKVLFTRGNEISLRVGTQVEMVLQRPLTIQPPRQEKL